MGFVVEARPSDSLYVETVMHGHTVSSGTVIRPAECHWHLVLVKHRGETQMLAVGPLTSAGALPYTEGVELLWIKFKLGVLMPHLPTAKLRDAEVELPRAAGQSFWLQGSAWRYPSYENADTFVSRLVREAVLTWDPLVSAALQHQRLELSPRTVRHRFLRATGLSRNQIEQVERAQRAELLLRQGASILDTVEAVGYADQPHLTRSLKRWIGHTPAHLLRSSIP